MRNNIILAVVLVVLVFTAVTGATVAFHGGIGTPLSSTLSASNVDRGVSLSDAQVNEDDADWDCATMGNLECGAETITYPDGSVYAECTAGMVWKNDVDLVCVLPEPLHSA